MAKARSIYIVQLILVLLVLALVPTSIGKLAVFVMVWAVTFGRWSKAEIGMFVVACVFFSVMNAMSLKQGIFAFREPDLLGMPWYEFLMRGFYLLHTRRVVDGGAPSPDWRVFLLAVAYSLAFATIQDQTILFVVTAVLLGAGLAVFHDPLDLSYAGYMVLLGAAVEYTGVWSGQWFYPGDPLGGVPPWFITLWGGVGLLFRRLVLPFVIRFENVSDPAA